MQKAELVLTHLSHKAKEDTTFRFGRLYRNLFNPDFYLNAYGKIYANEGNMTRGATGETVDGFGTGRIRTLIEEMRFERYVPAPVRRTYIIKKNGKQRPLGIPTFRDKLVQEIVRQILEAIYEPTFSKHSHGFRPGRSCQTALDRIKDCRGTSWVIEGDITGFFDNIDHDILLGTLKRRIDDGRLLGLIQRFLKAGYMEHGIRRDSVTGTPQGGLCKALHKLPYVKQPIMRSNTI